MDDDREPGLAGGGAEQEIAALRAALAAERQKTESERRRAQRWEREAVPRASSVAGALSSQILAAQRLARAVQSNLDSLGPRAEAMREIREAMTFFDEVRGAERR